MEKLDFLIAYLLKENKEIKLEKMPTNIEDKKNLWRSLCNIRDAKLISKEYLQIDKVVFNVYEEEGYKIYGQQIRKN